METLKNYQTVEEITPSRLGKKIELSVLQYVTDNPKQNKTDVRIGAKRIITTLSPGTHILDTDISNTINNLSERKYLKTKKEKGDQSHYQFITENGVKYLESLKKELLGDNQDLKIVPSPNEIPLSDSTSLIVDDETENETSLLIDEKAISERIKKLIYKDFSTVKQASAVLSVDYTRLSSMINNSYPISKDLIFALALQGYSLDYIIMGTGGADKSENVVNKLSSKKAQSNQPAQYINCTFHITGA